MVEILADKEILLIFLEILLLNLRANKRVMTAAAIKKQVYNYLPLLSAKQQALVLEMIKSFLNMDKDVKRISRKKYNKEIADAVSRMEKGESISHKAALKELAKW